MSAKKRLGLGVLLMCAFAWPKTAHTQANAGTFQARLAVDEEICGSFLGIQDCETFQTDVLNYSFTVSELARRLFHSTHSTAAHCTHLDPLEAECEHSVSIASDPGWHRIVWSKSGEFIATYGGWGSGVGELRSPGGVAVTHRTGSKHTAFVADTENNRIVVLVLDDAAESVTWVGTINGAQSGSTFRGPADVYWDHLNTWTRDDDRIYIADTGGHRIVAYQVDVDVSTGSMQAVYLGSFGAKGSGSGKLMYPRGVAAVTVSASITEVYVSDTGNDRVVRWRLPSGNFPAISSSVASIPGSHLLGITVDAHHDVIVTDAAQDRLWKLKRGDLAILKEYGGSSAWAQGKFNRPTDVTFVPKYVQAGSSMNLIRIPYVMTTEFWDSSSGGQLHRLGVEATNLAHFGSCGGSLNFTLTGATDRYRVTVTGSGGTRVFPLQYNPPQGYYPSGNYSQQWDGANTQGDPMPSGTYTLQVYTETPYDYDNNNGHTSQTTFNYNCNFHIYASVPSYVTVKAWYPLDGSATHSATDWEWQARTDSASWSFWADEQNTGWVAYAGEYVKDWKLSAQSTQGGGTNFDIETTYVCTTGSCGGGGGPAQIVAGDIGSPQSTSGQATATPVAITSGSALRSVSTSVDPIHFGSGIWVGREHAGTAYVDRYYSLLGQHDANLGEGEWPNLLESDSVAWTTAERADGLSHRVSSRRTQWKDGVSLYAIAGEIDAEKGGNSPISFALAADPDLGEPHDDELGFDESRELVWVGDVDSTFVGYVVLDAPRGANVAVVQYGMGLDDEPTRRAEAQQELAKESSWAEGVKGDVRFLLTVDRIDVDEHGRFEINLAVLRANSLAELTGLVDELRSSTGAVLASMAPPELSDDPEPVGLVPDEFALGQRLPGLQAVVQTGSLVRREAPMAHSVIGGQPSQGGASSAAVSQAIRVSGVTALNFDVPEASRVIIRIYDRTGAMIRTLLDEDVDAGAYAYGWDGLADTGQRKAPGVYYAVMEAEGFSDRSKLILVR